MVSMTREDGLGWVRGGWVREGTSGEVNDLFLHLGGFIFQQWADEHFCIS